MGAGAVGCYYGGMLARSGCDVTLVGRATHVEAVRRNGLRVEHRDFDARFPVKAAEDASGVRGARLVLFTVKSQDTERAGGEMKSFLEPGAAILSLQNGVDNAERLAALLGREVIGGCVYAAVEMAGPGHVKWHGRGELVIGLSEQSEWIAAAMRTAGIPVEVSANIAGMLWAKLVMNCAYNALSALAQQPYGKLVQGAGVPEMMDRIVDECLAVARAEGVAIPGDLHAAARRIAETMPNQFSSTAQDLAKGKPTEIEHLNGVVARKGEALGIATPLNASLFALVKVVELKRAGKSVSDTD
ncbi:MAG TPA: 2-dehydropantoate 2-reductase [Burkholderiales bacterium]|nr:2-dehydropantoate 2-reductase [Burkholderiales bacterium]